MQANRCIAPDPKVRIPVKLISLSTCLGCMTKLGLGESFHHTRTGRCFTLRCSTSMAASTPTYDNEELSTPPPPDLPIQCVESIAHFYVVLCVCGSISTMFFARWSYGWLMMIVIIETWGLTNRLMNTFGVHARSTCACWSSQISSILSSSLSKRHLTGFYQWSLGPLDGNYWTSSSRTSLRANWCLWLIISL